MTRKIKIITHDRKAHADETIAAATLRMAYGHVDVLRTRDAAVLRAEAGKTDTFLIDVGGRYDPARRLFDHHQPEGAGFRDAEAREWPYASAGLVWKEYGAAAVRAVVSSLDDDGVDEVVRHIDEAVLRYIDATDCGVKVRTAGPSLSALIASFNTTWWEKEEDVFPLVMDLAQVVLTNFIKRHAGTVLARRAVRDARQILGGQLLLLNACLPWSSIVKDEMPDVKLVAYPVDDGVQWQLRAAVNPDNTLRIKFPSSWAGLEGASLAAASGEPEAVFCHRNRYLAGAHTREGVLHMAQAALATCERELLAA